MREIMRLIATTIIWGAFISVAGITLSNNAGPAANMNGGEIVALMAIFMSGAVAMTYAVWHNGFNVGHSGNHAGRGKAKRTYPDRVDRLIEDLDDDTIYELEALLLARDREARELNQ